MLSFFKNLFSYIAKKGEYVRCVDDRQWNYANQTVFLQYGKIYKVLETIKCKDCGLISYDIGCRFTKEEITFTDCTEKHKLPGTNIRWAFSKRFVRAKFGDVNIEELKKEIQVCIQEEKYERAAELKKQLDTISHEK